MEGAEVKAPGNSWEAAARVPVSPGEPAEGLGGCTAGDAGTRKGLGGEVSRSPPGEPYGWTACEGLQPAGRLEPRPGEAVDLGRATARQEGCSLCTPAKRNL